MIRSKSEKGASMSTRSNDNGKSGDSGAEVTLDLLRRYDKAGPRYTSYPTAVEFDESYTNDVYHERLAEADQLVGSPLSVYIHLPFCEERCTYCGCNVVIAQRQDTVDRYFEYLFREIDRTAERLGGNAEIAEK